MNHEYEKYSELHIMLELDHEITIREIAEIQRMLKQDLDITGVADYHYW